MVSSDFVELYIAIAIVWLIIIALVLYNIMCLSEKVIKTIIGKGVKLQDSTTHRFKYILEPIFSHPTNGFNLKKSSINLEIITKTTIRLAKIPITSHCLYITRNLCLVRDIRAFFMIIRKRKPLPSITRIRAIHDCQTQDSKIFLEGIEVNDLKYGERRYYSIQAFILNENLNFAEVHQVKEQDIRFFSKQTLTPSFIPLSIEDFGHSLRSGSESDKIEENSESVEESNGIILSPKLEWFESIIFSAFLINLTFFLMVSILVFLKSLDTFIASVVAFSLSGFLSLLMTEGLSMAYKVVIKHNYNSNCAQMRVESGTHSKKWSYIRSFYLFLVFIMSVTSSVSIPIIIDERPDKKDLLSHEYEFTVTKNQILNQILFLLTFLSASLLITFTIWFLLFGMIRYFCRYTTTKRSKVVVDMESGNKDQSKQQSKFESKTEGDETVGSVRKSAIGSKTGKSVVKKSVKIKNSENKQKSQSEDDKKGKTPMFPIEKSEKSKSNSKKKDKYSKTGQLEFGTELLEKEMADTERRKRLATDSIIVKPTQSVGFINPESFRLKESQTALREKSHKTNNI